MIVELPFAYTARVVPPRARIAREVTVLDVLPLNIRELAPADFPVAARYASSTMEMRGEGIDDIRWDGKRFYRPFVYETANSRDRVPAALFEAYIQGHCAPNPFRTAQNLPNPNFHTYDIVQHAALAGRVEWEERQNRIAQLLTIANGTVLCDGSIWVACGEPCYEADHDGTVRAVLASARTVADKPAVLWRADRLQDYCDLYLGGQPPEHVFGHLELLLPEALSLAPERAHLGQAAGWAVNYLGDRARGMSIPQFTAYATLRDAVATCGGAITDDMAVAARAIIDDNPTDGRLQENLGKAYERWRRAIINDPAHDAALGQLPGGLAALR